MDKYEFKLKVDEMKALVSARNYNAAAEIAETINWRKIRNLNALVLAGEVFEQVERYEESKEILLMAYDKSPIGRNIIYRLAEIAIKTRNFEEAQEYYDEFVDIAPHDNLKFVLKYKMTAASGLPYKEQIQILEELKEQEYSEEWAYELAYLYHRDQQPEKCVEACDELILWFGDGIYVEKALELKMHYQALTKSQEEKYRMFRQKRTGVIEVKPNDFLESGEIVNEPVQIPSVEMNAARYNTANLQQEIAKGMQQIANATGKEGLSDGMNSIQKLVEDIPYQTDDPAEHQSQAIGQFTSSMHQILQEDPYWQSRRPLSENQQSFQENPYGQNRQIGQEDIYRQDLQMGQEGIYRQDPQMGQEGIYRQDPQMGQEGIYGQDVQIGQEYAGESQFVSQGQYGQKNQSQMSQSQGLYGNSMSQRHNEQQPQEPLPLVNQMSIEEILAEWEKTKQATQEALQESEGQSLENVKEKVLLDAEKLMERLMSIVPQLTSDTASQQSDISERKPEEVQNGLEEAGRIVAGMNRLLQEQIDSLTAQQSDGQAEFVHQVSDPTREMPKLPDYLMKEKESGPPAAQIDNHHYERNGKNTSDMDETIAIHELKNKVEENTSLEEQTETSPLSPKQEQGRTEIMPEPANKAKQEALQKFEEAKQAMMAAMKELQAENADNGLFDQEFYEKFAGINLGISPQAEQPEEHKAEKQAENQSEDKLSNQTGHSETGEKEKEAKELLNDHGQNNIGIENTDGNSINTAQVKLSAVEMYSTKGSSRNGVPNAASGNAQYSAVEKYAAKTAGSTGQKAAESSEPATKDESKDSVEGDLRSAADKADQKSDKKGLSQETVSSIPEKTEKRNLSEPDHISEQAHLPDTEQMASQSGMTELEDVPSQSGMPEPESISVQRDFSEQERPVQRDFSELERPRQRDFSESEVMSVQSDSAQAAGMPEPVYHPEEHAAAQTGPVENKSMEEQLYPARNPDVDLRQTDPSAYTDMDKVPEGSDEPEQPHMSLASRPKFRTQAQIQAEESIGQPHTRTEDDEEISEEDMASAAQAAGFYQDTPQADASGSVQIKHLTSEQRSIFSYFVLIKGMEGQIYDLLKGVSDHLLFDKNSISGNIIVEGIQGSGKTVLIKNIIMCLQRQVKRPNGKIGKIDANALNQKDLDVLTEKISGGCLIIESAGKITRETAVKLSRCMEKDHTGTLYILEDTKQGIQKALERDSSFAAKFTEKITIPLFTNDELVAFGRAYANDLDYDIDEMGVLALYKRINSIQKLDHVTTLTEVKEIVDEAIENAEKGVLKKVFGILTSTRSNDDNYVILREKDFEV